MLARLALAPGRCSARLLLPTPRGAGSPSSSAFDKNDSADLLVNRCLIRRAKNNSPTGRCWRHVGGLGAAAHPVDGHGDAGDEGGDRGGACRTRTIIMLLHCNTTHPMAAPPRRTAMATRARPSMSCVGDPDDVGIEVVVAAEALGAEVIDKHLDDHGGLDHVASLEPAVLRRDGRGDSDGRGGARHRADARRRASQRDRVRRAQVAGGVGDPRGRAFGVPDNVTAKRPGAHFADALESVMGHGGAAEDFAAGRLDIQL